MSATASRGPGVRSFSEGVTHHIKGEVEAFRATADARAADDDDPFRASLGRECLERHFAGSSPLTIEVRGAEAEMERAGLMYAFHSDGASFVEFERGKERPRLQFPRDLPPEAAFASIKEEVEQALDAQELRVIAWVRDQLDWGPTFWAVVRPRE
jgi:hypothetical protein